MRYKKGQTIRGVKSGSLYRVILTPCDTRMAPNSCKPAYVLCQLSSKTNLVYEWDTVESDEIFKP